MKQILILLSLFAFISCQSNGTDDVNSSQDQSLLALNYGDIVGQVMTGSGERIEYHGESIDTEAKADLELVEKTTGCTSSECGQGVYINNIGDRSIRVTTYSPFQVGTIESHAATVVVVAAGESTLLGCSNFCFNGQSYPFQHSIAGASYID